MLRKIPQIHIVDAPEERRLVPNAENSHECNALIVHMSYQIVHHPLQNLYHHHHHPHQVASQTQLQSGDARQMLEPCAYPEALRYPLEDAEESQESRQ